MESEIIKTNHGLVQGTVEGDCVVFKGIPYAQAPVGNLRWRAPRPLHPWQGILKADHYGNQSAQKDWSSEPPGLFTREFHSDPESSNPSSEDSLYLNIRIPQKRRSAPLPVAFYVHGGAFMGGCGHEATFRTDAYAKKGVILVTFNYRLGIFGFLAHPWLAKEDPDACGNYGLLDQIAALTWVYENISAFGGDPRQITIMGQSAGCMSVRALLSILRSGEKFTRAIMQSGAGYPTLLGSDISLEEGFLRGQYAVEFSGVQSLEGLRSLTTKQICEIQEKVYAKVAKLGGGLAFSPVTNKTLLPLPIDEMTEKGMLADVPVMIGTTKNDMTVLPEEAAAKDSRFQAACRRWAQIMEENGHQPSYVYYFTHDLPGDDAGAFHSSELWYMFGSLNKCWRPMTDDDYALSEKMVSYWTNFIKTGNPNGSGLPTWLPCTSQNPFQMMLDI